MKTRSTEPMCVSPWRHGNHSWKHFRRAIGYQLEICCCQGAWIKRHLTTLTFVTCKRKSYFRHISANFNDTLKKNRLFRNSNSSRKEMRRENCYDNNPKLIIVSSFFDKRFLIAFYSTSLYIYIIVALLL